jgi:hypothetical protein
VVHSESSPSVPKNILAAAKEKRQKLKMKLYIVQYYDKQNSWCVARHSSLARSNHMTLYKAKCCEGAITRAGRR